MFMNSIMKPSAIGLGLFLIFSAFSCNVQMDKTGTQTGTPVPDTVFTSLFMGECYGFTGGDGTYSVPLPDGRIVWIFGDTFIGGVNEDNTRQLQDPKFIRNSVVVQDGDSVRTLFQTIDGQKASFAIPRTDGKQESENDRWLWPGDGLIENGLLKIFYSEFTQQDTGMWGFRWEGTWIGSYSLPGLEELDLQKLYDRKDTPIHFGHAVFVDDTHTYVYGAGDIKNPYAARYPNGNVNGAWEFYTGGSWTNDITRAMPMDDIGISEQFSVFKLKNTCILLTQMGELGPDIYSFTSDTPYGPWDNKQLLYTIPLPDSAHNLITYNALAHPHLIRDHNLLVSYNTNSTELRDHYRDASIYRPRFVWVPLDRIDSTLNH